MIHSRSEALISRAGKALEDHQVARMLALELELRNQIILELFVYCGLHLCELAPLEIARLQWDRKEIDVLTPGYRGRGGIRQVPLPDSTAAKLRKWIGRRLHGYVFPGRDGPHLTERAIQDVVRAAGRRIGVHLSPMILRHTCVRRLQGMGFDYEAVTKILGLINLARVARIYPMQTFEEVKSRFLGTFVA